MASTQYVKNVEVLDRKAKKNEVNKYNGRRKENVFLFQMQKANERR